MRSCVSSSIQLIFSTMRRSVSERAEAASSCQRPGSKLFQASVRLRDPPRGVRPAWKQPLPRRNGMRAALHRAGQCALVGVISWPAAAGEAVRARVSPTAGLAPCDIVIQAFIEPHALNRAVSFIVDSGTFYSRSVSELDGDRSPRTKEVRFRMLPAGSYEVRVTVIGSDGERGQVLGSVHLRWDDAL